jgi:outer membrane biogenesis lipoprotein LolB
MIKKSVLVIFLFFFIFNSCLSDKKPTSNSNIKLKISGTKLKNYKSIDNIGKIEVYDDDDNVYFVINWTSRSRRLLKVLGKYKDEIKALKGKIIEVEGKTTYETEWSGTIEIEKYKVIEK